MTDVVILFHLGFLARRWLEETLVSHNARRLHLESHATHEPVIKHDVGQPDLLAWNAQLRQVAELVALPRQELVHPFLYISKVVARRDEKDVSGKIKRKECQDDQVKFRD